MLMQNLGGQTKGIMVFSEMPYFVCYRHRSGSCLSAIN